MKEVLCAIKTLKIHHDIFCTTHKIDLSTILHFSQCQCGCTINDLGIHLLCCPCGRERTVAHDTFWNTIGAIISKSGAHVQRKVFHLFFYHTQRQVDIVITRDIFRILVDVVIVNLTHTNLVQHALTTTHPTTVIAQNKAWSYIERTQGNDFIPP